MFSFDRDLPEVHSIHITSVTMNGLCGHIYVRTTVEVESALSTASGFVGESKDPLQQRRRASSRPYQRDRQASHKWRRGRRRWFQELSPYRASKCRRSMLHSEREQSGIRKTNVRETS